MTTTALDRRRRRHEGSLLDYFASALGPPVSTPRLVMGDDGLKPAAYRVHRWRCPACLAGYGDPIYRPFVLDTDGKVFCEANRCGPKAIVTATRAMRLGAP